MGGGEGLGTEWLPGKYSLPLFPSSLSPKGQVTIWTITQRHYLPLNLASIEETALRVYVRACVRVWEREIHTNGGNGELYREEKSYFFSVTQSHLPLRHSGRARAGWTLREREIERNENDSERFFFFVLIWHSNNSFEPCHFRQLHLNSALLALAPPLIPLKNHLC